MENPNSRNWASVGHRTKEDATRVLDESLSERKICQSDTPDIKAYVNGNNAIRYGITVGVKGEV